MTVLPAELSAADVLKAFHRDEPYFFLGSVFTTLGLLSIAFSYLRRKADPLLLSFAAFSILYGQRLWIRSELLQMTIGYSTLYLRLRTGIDFLVPIPGVLFFLYAPGLLRGIGPRIGGYVIMAVSAVLSLLTFAAGPSPHYYFINSVMIIAACLALAAQYIGVGPGNPDLRIIRRGLLIFVAFIFWENVKSVFHWPVPNLEPIGFLAFLTSLGYVATRRTLERDYQLGEIRKELEVARRIQQSILPAAFPDSPHFRVAARYVPMTSVAGDFYDFVVAEPREAGLLIADVSGHGVPAALIASMVKLAAASQRDHAANPSAFLTGMNAALRGNTQEQFVTAAYVHLDSARSEFRYSAAGHPPMLLLRHGTVTAIEQNGLMLAAFDHATYSSASGALQPGDRLLLYTDGLLEAANQAGDFFGREALHALFAETAAFPPNEAADRIVTTVQQWSASQDDDLTLLLCDYLREA
jgi:sigma-B regulation protein RsbU (phosphoserine phosphatase)